MTYLCATLFFLAGWWSRRVIPRWMAAAAAERAEEADRAAWQAALHHLATDRESR